MTNSLSQLKKSMSGKSADALSAQLDKLNEKQTRSNEDDRLWKPTYDKSGRAEATIRFLPAPAGEDTPFVRLWDHAFQGPGGWLFENSLTTLGQDCPISEYNKAMWATGSKANQEFVSRNSKRRLNYYANIYVVSDANAPENEGKVFLYRFGAKIMEHIQKANKPAFSDVTPINAFNPWDTGNKPGANFHLRAELKAVGNRKLPNYDASSWSQPCAAFDDDSELEAIWKQAYSLQEFVDPKNFKSAAEIKARLDKVMTKKDATPTMEEQMQSTAEPEVGRTAPEPRQPKAERTPWDDEDADLAEFAGLVDDD